MIEAYQIEKTEQMIIITPKDHKNTLIWLHGLACSPQSNLMALIEVLENHLPYTKVIIPCAPTRFVTVMQKQSKSWFDIKFRGKQSFQVPFDDAFSSAQVHDSFQRILKPLIDAQKLILNKVNQKGKLIVAGFSQGCGLAIHCLYESENVDCALGVAGYFFPITKFNSELSKPLRIIYGLADKLRPWQYTKTTYQGKVSQQKIKLVQGMKHQLSQGTLKQMKEFFEQILVLN